MYFVGKQEAETEVFLDRIINKEGSKDRALLFIVSEIPNENKVFDECSSIFQIFGLIHSPQKKKKKNKTKNIKTIK